LARRKAGRTAPSLHRLLAFVLLLTEMLAIVVVLALAALAAISHTGR
jgi:hypothetical protein